MRGQSSHCLNNCRGVARKAALFFFPMLKEVPTP
jgi:hypothetical protein